MNRLGLLGLIILCGVLAATNPSRDAHKKTMSETSTASQAKPGLFGGFATSVMADANALSMSYNNYYLFSTTTLNGRTASVGLFSHVWKLK
jgi:hypothetical protein